MKKETWDAVFRELSKIKELQYLELTGCSISNLPDTIGLLKELKWLDLRNNNLKELPDSISKLSNLEFLEYVYKFTAIVLLVAGVLDIKDGITKNKKPFLSIPKGASPKIKKYIHRATIPAAIVLGGMVALFELPCTGGVYLAILSILSKEGLTSSGVWLLALYNFIFVLPLIIILLLVTFGLSSEKVEKWRKQNKNAMRILIGIAMIVLGVLMLSNTI